MINKDDGVRKYTSNVSQQPYGKDGRYVPEHLKDDAFGVAEPTVNTPPSGTQNIDALLNGIEWQNPNVTFSFTDSYASDYEVGYPGEATHSTSFQQLNSTQQTATRDWMRDYAHVSNLNPTELTGLSDRDATIRLASSDDPSTAYAYYPGDYVAGGDIWIGQFHDYTNPKIGTYAYHTFGHEVGHAVGLKHGHEAFGVSNVALTTDRDSMEFSIMTYRSYVGGSLSGYENAEGSYAQSLMMYDIAAVQHTYGVQYDNVNTTYTFSNTTGEMFVNGVGEDTPYTNTIFRTVWDNGGVDTYDFSNYNTKLNIDLKPGGWSDVDTTSNFQTANLGNGNFSRGNVFNALQYQGDNRSLIENASGGSNDDTLSGNDLTNALNGNDGNDTLFGLAGNDTLTGWSGADTMIGGIGNDSYYVENAGDVVTEQLNEGIDTVSSKLTYSLPANVENLILTGTLTVNGIGNSLNNAITGNNAANQLNGDAGNDTINGGAGDDTLIGWSGADNMLGGLGNDSYFVENAGDVVTENLNQGTDTVSSRLTYTLPANVENLTLTGTSAVNGTGNGLANVITGNATNNQLNGGVGNDILNDGAGNDTLNGGAGNDTLDGGIGTNTLTGGTGNDIFKFTTLGHIDTITDYNVANDTIQLENAVFTALTTTGTLAAGQFRIGTQAVDANDFIIYNNATGALLYDANGSSAGAAIQIATIGVGLAMTNADFVII